MWWGIMSAALLVGSYSVGLAYGIQGVAAAFTIMNYLFLIPSLFFCFHQTPISVALFLKAVIYPLTIGLIAMSGAALVKMALPQSLITSHLLVFLVFMGLYIGLSSFRKSLRASINQILNDLQIPDGKDMVEQLRSLWGER